MDDGTLPLAMKGDRRSLLKRFGAAAIGISFGGLVAGCESTGPKPSEKIAPTGEEAKLNFYNWDTYIGETTLDDFNDASGTSVAMTYFANNDELFANCAAAIPAMM